MGLLDFQNVLHISSVGLLISSLKYGISICLMRKQYLCLMMRVKERAPTLDHLKQGVKRGENIASMGDTGTGMDGGDTERMVISRGIHRRKSDSRGSREERRRDRERTD